MRIGVLFDNVRIDVDDAAENHYTDALLLVPYNKINRSVLSELMRLNSPIAMSESSVTTVVDTQEYELPSDFAAMVERSFRPSDSRVHLEQIDEQEKALSTEGSGDSRSFYITVSGTTQYVGLRHPPSEVKTYNFKYWPIVTRQTEALLDSTEMPYLGILDDVFHEALVFYAKNHREFNAQVELAWLRSAINDAATLLGLRKNRERFSHPSMFKGMPRWR